MKRTPTVAEFLASMAEVDGCWPWVGYVTEHGYGATRRGSDRLLYVHRIAYELAKGPIPAGQVIDHKCHVAGECVPEVDSDCPHRRCANPVRLVATTQRGNSLRGNSPTAANANKETCPQNHPMSGRNLINLARGGRRCRACHNASQRARWHRNNARGAS